MGGRPDEVELQRLGVYDSGAPDAAQQLELLSRAFEMGATVDEVVRASRVSGVGPLMLDLIKYPVGPAGTITVHNCRTVHGSASNRSDHPRPLLLQTYAAADAFSYTDLVKQSPHGEELIRGEPARWARHDPRPCLMPPTGPYRPIFAVQQGEASP